MKSKIRTPFSAVLLKLVLLFKCLGGVLEAGAASLSETHSPDTVLVGSKLTFKFTLSSPGTAPGVFTNRIPPNAVFTSATVTNGSFTVSNNVFYYTPVTTPPVPQIVFDLVITPVTAQTITNIGYWKPAFGAGASAGSFVPVSSVLAGPKLVVGRVDHQSTRLLDGRVLITGGVALVAEGTLRRTNSAEVFNPTNETFGLVSNMITPRSIHSATLLKDGMVLVAGGIGNGATNSSLELFDPTNNVFLAAGNMAVQRTMHSATALPNGDVILAGGDKAGTLIERFSRTNGQVSIGSAGNLLVSRRGHVAALLASGEIIFAGGADPTNAFAEKFNPQTGLSVAVAPAGHEIPAIAVAAGKVLLYGSTAIASDFGAETFDLETYAFSTISNPPAPFFEANYLTLGTGEVLISSGYNTLNVYRCDVRAGRFSPSYPINVARSAHSGVELADERVLLTGGYDIVNTMTGDMRSTELYSLRLDHDQDGMEDGWEVQNGLDPGNQADAIADADGDGHSNLQEYLAGTDPRDPTSVLHFQDVQRSGNNVVIRFGSILGKFYRVQRMTNIAVAGWINVSEPLPGTGASIELTDPVLAGVASQIYRIVLLP